jgi:hypothetical protein
MNENWYIGSVVEVNDPDKRKRLKVRGPNEPENNVPVDSLPWLNPFTAKKDDFQLPDVGESVLILIFGRMKLWSELPDKSSWADFSNDDYATAFKEAHKDKYSKTYTETDGWNILYSGNLKETNDKVILETDGSTLKLTVDKAIIETDGSKISLKNDSMNLFTILSDLITAIKTETHMTPAGLSGPPMADVITKYDKASQDLSNLLY